MKQGPKYTYERNGCEWIIREWKYTEHVGEGTKIDVKYSFEEARDEVYRLNGWKLKDQQHETQKV